MEEKYKNSDVQTNSCDQATGSIRHDNQIRQQLYEKRMKLSRQLDEVQQAIDNLSDPSVQKVMQILNVAQR